ncbi:PDZ domain-containing protein [Planctomycetota bacterium]
MQRSDISWPHIYMPGGTSSPAAYRWHISVWPTMYIMDDLGYIRYNGDENYLSPDVLEGAVETLLAEMEGGPEARPDVRLAVNLIQNAGTPYEQFDGYVGMQEVLSKYEKDKTIVKLANRHLKSCEQENSEILAGAKTEYEYLNSRANEFRRAINQGGSVIARSALLQHLAELEQVASKAGSKSRLAAELNDYIQKHRDTFDGSAFLGVYYEDCPTGKGIRITGIIPGSAAEKYNLKEGDVIQKIDGTNADSGKELPKILKQFKPWDTISFTLKPEGNAPTETVKLTLGRRLPD